MADEIPDEDVAATFPMPKDIAAELLAEQDLPDLVIPEDALPSRRAGSAFNLRIKISGTIFRYY
jgi:hypothetical protein